MSSTYISEPGHNGKLIIHTNKGPLDIELWSKEAKFTVRNFIQHALNGYYDQTKFHRLVPNFILQGGDPTGTGHGGESALGTPIPIEKHQRLTFNRRGLVGMADEYGQFFFTLASAMELTGKHTVFGRVVGNTIYNLMDMTNAVDVDVNDKPLVDIRILSIDVVDNPFDDLVPRLVPSTGGGGTSSTHSSHRDSTSKSFSKKRARVLLSFADGDDMDGREHSPFIIDKRRNQAFQNQRATSHVHSSSNQSSNVQSVIPVLMDRMETQDQDPHQSSDPEQHLDPNPKKIIPPPPPPPSKKPKRKSKPLAIQQWELDRQKYTSKTYTPIIDTQLTKFKTKLMSTTAVHHQSSSDIQELASKEEDECFLHTVAGCLSCRTSEQTPVSMNDDGWLRHMLKFPKPDQRQLAADDDTYLVIDPRDYRG